MAQAGPNDGMISFTNLSRQDILIEVDGRTLDKENYFIIYNIFDFSRSKEELAAYIKNYR